jgi:hypothetical protein
MTPRAAKLREACSAACANDAALQKRRTKRNEAVQKIDAAKKGNLARYSDQEVEVEAQIHGAQHVVLGKDIVAAIRKKARDDKLSNVASFGRQIPAGLATAIASDLKIILEAITNA